MKPRQQNLVLGLVAIAMIALFVGSILFIVPRVGYATQTIQIQFRHKEGIAPLKVGSPVVLGGSVHVGRVTDITTRVAVLDTPAGRTKELVIVVKVEIDATITLYEDCHITTDQPAVGGTGSVVILNVGTHGRPLVGVGPVLGLPPQSFGAAIGTLSRRLLGPGGIVDKIDAMLDPEAQGSLHNLLRTSLADLNAITAELRAQANAADQHTLLGRLQQILDNVGGTTAALRAELSTGDEANLLAQIRGAIDRLTRTLEDASALVSENRLVIHQTLEHLRGASRQLDEELLARLKADLDRDNPSSLLGKTHVAMNQLNASLADVNAISQTGRGLIFSNRSALARTLENLKAMSEQLRLTSEELRLAPWRLLYKPTPRETEEMSVFEAARTFAEAATYLDDAAARLEAIASAPTETAASDAEIAAMRDSLKAAFQRFQRAETFLYERMR
jgi:ABC-type transporter Mla subunit MlaD